MKIFESIKSFKFLDFRKYISANLFVVAFCALLILYSIYSNTSYQVPVEIFGWGEPHVEFSPEEEKIWASILICFFTTIFLAYIFLAEFLLRAAIELIIKKFFPKCTNKKASILKFQVPKFIILAYSVVFYLIFASAIIFFLVVLHSV